MFVIIRLTTEPINDNVNDNVLYILTVNGILLYVVKCWVGWPIKIKEVFP